jgi:cytochrome P450
MARSAQADLYSYPAVELKRLLYFMSKDPSNYIAHMEEYTSRTISRLAWGSEEHATELRVGTFGLLVTISPSGAVPNVVAPLRYLPTWMSPWKQRENARHERENKFFKGCFETVKEAHAKGESKPSYTKMFLEEQEKSGVREEEGQYIVGMMAIAGALTIGSPMQSYILAMCHYPQWQDMMREEIQRVCGDKCPTWEDRAQLPTIRAVVKEVIRWRPPVPTGTVTCVALWFHTLTRW